MKQLQIHPSFHVTDREQERFNVIQLLVRHDLYLPEGMWAVVPQSKEQSE